MRKIFLLISLLAFTIFSCKDESKDVEKVESKPQTFDVTLNMVVPKDDKFQLFYTDESVVDFDEKKSIWIDVKGSDSPQDIIFQLPPDEIPSNIRIDLGTNETQSPMKLNSFEMSYFSKSFTLKDSLILSHFVIGEQLMYDKKTSILTPNKGKAEVYDPLLYPQSIIKDEIIKLVQ